MRYRLCSEGNSEEGAYRQKRTHSSTLSDFWGLISPRHFRVSDHKAGSHAFRRFRNTYLKNETACPKGLRDYWLGHAGNSMDDLYDMVKDNIVLRKKKTLEYGVGFELPFSASMIPNAPKKQRKLCAAKAA